MKTTLTLNGPPDLSVGDITITTETGSQTKWIATSESREYVTEEAEPGVYLVEIKPPGVGPRTVAFNVQPGQANTVNVPSFSYLSTLGNGVTVLTDNEPLKWPERSGEPAPQTKAVTEAGWISSRPQKPVETSSLAISPPKVALGRRLTMAIAMEGNLGRESWQKFSGHCSAELSNGTVALTLQPPKTWSPTSEQRARLTIAIQGIRIERFLLPFYDGGTIFRISTSSVSESDVEIEVLPAKASTRAIWRALDAGTRDHAAAIRDTILEIEGELPDPNTMDPWRATLAALLFLRFPDDFGQLSDGWVKSLSDSFPWAADTHIIRAKQAAMTAIGAPSKLAKRKAQLAVQMLLRAQKCGSPYFTLSNQFFSEMIEGLSNFKGLSNRSLEALNRAKARWRREQPLQRAGRTAFSWLSRDLNRLKKENVLAPKRDVTGRLSGRNTTVVFKGQIQAGEISFGIETKRGSWSVKPVDLVMKEKYLGNANDNSLSGPVDCPALKRPLQNLEDPNFGRFGGKASQQGFRLSSEFSFHSSSIVTIRLKVVAEKNSNVSPGDSVWFCLHPTFNPQWVRTHFQGFTATLVLRAWGGFTVGAWLPAQRVELECDLSRANDAPLIIRTK